MNNQINIAEILIVNGAGVFCLLYLLVLPVVVAYALTVLNCLCKTGLLFSISSDNVYTRGRFGLYSYVVLAFYYL